MKPYDIFCDMDQVLVNFLKGSRLALGKEFNDPSLGSDSSKFRYLAAHHPYFWRELPWMPEARVLWQRLVRYNPWILTACPSDEDFKGAADEKRVWCRQELGMIMRVETVNRHQKQTFAITHTLNHGTRSNLLIDDHPTNVEEWRDKGGIAILHQTVPETLQELTQLGL